MDSPSPELGEFGDELDYSDDDSMPRDPSPPQAIELFRDPFPAILNLRAQGTPHQRIPSVPLNMGAQIVPRTEDRHQAAPSSRRLSPAVPVHPFGIIGQRRILPQVPSNVRVIERGVENLGVEEMPHPRRHLPALPHEALLREAAERLEQHLAQSEQPRRRQLPRRTAQLVHVAQQPFSCHWQAGQAAAPQFVTHLGPVEIIGSIPEDRLPWSPYYKGVIRNPYGPSTSVSTTSSNSASPPEGSSTSSSAASSAQPAEPMEEESRDQAIPDAYHEEYERIMSKRRGRHYSLDIRPLCIDATLTSSDSTSSIPSFVSSASSSSTELSSASEGFSNVLISQEPKKKARKSEPELLSEAVSDTVSFERAIRRAIQESLQTIPSNDEPAENNERDRRASAPVVAANGGRRKSTGKAVKLVTSNDLSCCSSSMTSASTASSRRESLQRLGASTSQTSLNNNIECFECGQKVFEEDFPRHLQSHGQGRRCSRTAFKRIAASAAEEATLLDFEDLPMDVTSDGEDDTTYGSKKKKSKKSKK